jgi:hypothetical protein
VPRAPYAKDPSADISIITGNNRYIGLRATPAPDVKYSAIMPAVATIIAIGSNRINGLAAGVFGTSGGRSTTTGPTSMGGPGTLAARTNSIDELDVAAAATVPHSSENFGAPEPLTPRLP